MGAVPCFSTIRISVAEKGKPDARSIVEGALGTCEHWCVARLVYSGSGVRVRITPRSHSELGRAACNMIIRTAAVAGSSVRRRPTSAHAHPTEPRRSVLVPAGSASTYCPWRAPREGDDRPDPCTETEHAWFYSAHP